MTNLRRAREIAWHLAERAHKTLYERAGVNFLSIETEFELANVLRDLCDELDRVRFFYTLFKSLAEHGPHIAEALEKSAQAAKLWTEGFVDALARKDAEIEHFQYTIGELVKEKERLLRMLEDLEWCGWSTPCSGADCCPWCRTPHKQGHEKDCLFSKVKP